LAHSTNTLDWIEQQIRAEKAELQRIEATSKSNETILRESISAVKNVILDSSNRKVPHIDEAISAKNVVYNQLYELVAEDHAIEDTIYMLGKALDRDRIKLEPFMKHSRTLAREQFMKKALVNKIASEIF
jgi:ESCRT-I complex subunit TSG101